MSNTISDCNMSLAAAEIGMGPDALRAALERARVVSVLDGWANAIGRHVDFEDMRLSSDEQDFAEGRGCRVSLYDGKRVSFRFGNTPDEARAKAAAAIEAGEAPNE